MIAEMQILSICVKNRVERTSSGHDRDTCACRGARRPRVDRSHRGTTSRMISFSYFTQP